MARKSPYQARIEKVLASKTFSLNTIGLVDVMRGIEEGGVWGGDIWQLACDDQGNPKIRYGHASCQLCGKPHIKWQFFIKQRHGSAEMVVGSECAKNFAHSDLINHICRELRIEYNKVKYSFEYGDLEDAVNWFLNIDDSLRYIAPNVVGLGRYDAKKLLRKVREGKQLTRDDKAAIDRLMHFHKNQEEFYAGVRAIQFKIQVQRMHRGMIGVLYILKYFFLLAEAREYGVHVMVTDLPYPRFIIGKIHAARVERAKAEEQAKAENRAVTGHDALFNSLFALNLRYSDHKFVSSVHAYYKRYGRVTEKQEAVLRKIANRYGERDVC